METFELTPEQHHYLGICSNQQVWALLGQPELTEKEQSRMEHLALSSLFHWHRSHKFQPINAQRGHWLLARVYAVLHKSDEALHHARQCYDLTLEHGFDGFDLAYALEAMARGYAASGEVGNAKKFREKANEAGHGIQGDQEREMFFNDLDDAPWFGVFAQKL